MNRDGPTASKKMATDRTVLADKKKTVLKDKKRTLKRLWDRLVSLYRSILKTTPRAEIISSANMTQFLRLTKI